MTEIDRARLTKGSRWMVELTEDCRMESDPEWVHVAGRPGGLGANLPRSALRPLPTVAPVTLAEAEALRTHIGAWGVGDVAACKALTAFLRGRFGADGLAKAPAAVPATDAEVAAFHSYVNAWGVGKSQATLVRDGLNAFLASRVAAGAPVTTLPGFTADDVVVEPKAAEWVPQPGERVMVVQGAHEGLVGKLGGTRGEGAGNLIWYVVLEAGGDCWLPQSSLAPIRPKPAWRQQPEVPAWVPAVGAYVAVEATSPYARMRGTVIDLDAKRGALVDETPVAGHPARRVWIPIDCVHPALKPARAYNIEWQEVGTASPYGDLIAALERRVIAEAEAWEAAENSKSLLDAIAALRGARLAIATLEGR
jgi:hypothetical protein